MPFQEKESRVPFELLVDQTKMFNLVRSILTGDLRQY